MLVKKISAETYKKIIEYAFYKNMYFSLHRVEIYNTDITDEVCQFILNKIDSNPNISKEEIFNSKPGQNLDDIFNYLREDKDVFSIQYLTIKTQENLNKKRLECVKNLEFTKKLECIKFSKNDVQNKIHHSTLKYMNQNKNEMIKHINNSINEIDDELNNLSTKKFNEERDNNIYFAIEYLRYSNYINKLKEQYNIIPTKVGIEYSSDNNRYSTVYVFKLTKNIKKYLLNRENLYEWVYPINLENLCLFKGKRCWLYSVAHEHLCEIYCDDEEEFEYLKSVGVEFYEDKFEKEEPWMKNYNIG